MKKSAYWLLKTEPETYSFDQLIRDKKTHWNGVRNFQARNFLREAEVGDLAIIYHSGDERAAVGLAKVIRSGYPDLDPAKPGDWVQIDIEPVTKLAKPIALSEIKNETALKDILLIRQSRLSVMPITEMHFQTILKMSGDTQLYQRTP
jgi:predicted RNA-binding protein with PUA-like domain